MVTEKYKALIERFPLVPIKNDAHLDEAHEVARSLMLRAELIACSFQRAGVPKIGSRSLDLSPFPRTAISSESPLCSLHALFKLLWGNVI